MQLDIRLAGSRKTTRRAMSTQQNVWNGSFLDRSRAPTFVWDELNDAEAARYWEMAAAEGLALAQFQLGWCFVYGLGVMPDSEEAAKWYQLAAEQGAWEAQYNVANFFMLGDGVDKDLEKAMMWFRRLLSMR